LAPLAARGFFTDLSSGFKSFERKKDTTGTATPSPITLNAYE
jgi:hypothetical protein